MYNWSVDTKKLASHSRKHSIWKLEQLINFGLGREKLNVNFTKRHLGVLHLDPAKKRYLKFLLK